MRLIPELSRLSLKKLLLTQEYLLLVLLLILGLFCSVWAYSWQQTSVESLRLTGLIADAYDIRVLLFRQIKAVFYARLAEDPKATEIYNDYSRQIDSVFNALRQRTLFRDESLAVQAMQSSYRTIQADMNNVRADPYLINRIVRLKILDPRYEQTLVGEFEATFSSLQQQINSRLRLLELRMGKLTWLTPLLVILPISLAFIVLIWTRRTLQQGFVQPITHLIEGTRLMSTGNLDHLIKEEGVAEMARLARSVNLMATDLAKSRDTLIEKEKQAALGALVPVLAHNIRNPLASIRATAQLLDYEDGQASLDETRSAIISTVDRLVRWVSALVSYLHPYRINRVHYSLSRLLNNALALLTEQITRKNLQVTHRQLAIELQIFVDVDLMEQALCGLLNNAIEATPVNSILLIEELEHDANWEIRITDQGPGMPFLPKPSGLTPGPTTKRYGTGLGIPVAYKICASHAWNLEFENLPKGGTRVRLLIPKDPAPENSHG